MTAVLAGLLVQPDMMFFHEDEIGLLWQILYEGKSWFVFHFYGTKSEM